MIIAVDGMGGDNAPDCIIEGCISAVKEINDLKIILAGQEEILKEKLSEYDYSKEKIEILNCTEIISNNEHPAMAIRKKKDSSLVRCMNLVKKGEADAVISAGSTGALLAGALFIIGRIKGIDRPAIAPILPCKNGPSMLIDCGANAECKPLNLLQFAYMGQIYFKNILNVENPTVGLINIGAEEEKGNLLTKEAYQLLKKSSLNFVGNVEPRDISTGDTNVLVCDGFVGNTVLKMYEGVASNMFSIIKDEIFSSTLTKFGGMFLKPAFSNIKKRFDYKEYGGAAFLGVKGVCIKAHGSSDGKAIKNAIMQAIKFNENGVIEKIKFYIENEINQKSMEIKEEKQE